ncbi:hypothetical protein Syun_013357 [Stephania yunnanensis]|uniref:Inhibitor I9 domain-containing protein n=1 Tax=Stephania yunnanensis TaxID=152371 RepID=A0AAP0K3E7_9MAGN
MKGSSTGRSSSEVYFVFMNFDPEYERLQSLRLVLSHSTKQLGSLELDLYLSNKHDEFLANMLGPGTYKKRFSWVVIDGFSAEITDDQADLLRSAREVRIVEKDLELS